MLEESFLDENKDTFVYELLGLGSTMPNSRVLIKNLPSTNQNEEVLAIDINPNAPEDAKSFHKCESSSSSQAPKNREVKIVR